MRLVLTLTLAALLSSCYYLQAASGQLALMSARRPIIAVLADPATPADLARRLEYVRSAREFAVQSLALPDNDSYLSYADLGRPYAVWNVFATRRYSTEARRWCFPVAGCVVYRGYFDQSAAERYAIRLRMSGWDAAVAGASAYSTLGHFADPVLNTMMGWSDARLAGTLFHELAHQVVYVAGDSSFNEAFASVVEEAGVERWLSGDGRRHELLLWREQRQRADQFVALLLDTRARLTRLYASGLAEEDMAREKSREFGLLKYRYQKLRAQWGDDDAYDGWFDRALNNAHLVPVDTYRLCMPGFKRLLAEQEGNLSAFYAAVRVLAAQSTDARRRAVCDVAAAASREPAAGMPALHARFNRAGAAPSVAADTGAPQRSSALE